MVVGAHDGHEVGATGDPGGMVRIRAAVSYREVGLTVVDRHGNATQVFLTPLQARDVALYLLREQRLVEEGRG